MDNASPLFIGLDCSTSACKAIVWDCRGAAIGTGVQPLSVITPRPTWHEQPAEEWRTAACKAIRQAVSGVDGRRLKALSIAHQRETFVPVDAEGRPLSNGILWMDERARGLLPGLEASFGGREFHRLTGKQLSVNLTIAKIAWIREFQPDIFARTAKYLDVHGFLARWLTGICSTGWGSADPTGLFDIERHAWAGDLLARIGIRTDQLPDTCAPGTILGTLLPSAAEECGLPKDLPVVAGLGDGQASGLGAGITAPGDAYLSLGTSVISGSFCDAYVFDPAFRTMTGGIPGTFLLETVLLGGGYTVSWFLEKMAARPGEAPSQLQEFYDRAAGEVPPGSEGLMAVPYWNSVLGPYWDPAASGIVVGWRGVHALPHLYRAILEGMAFEQRLGTMGVEEALRRSINRYIAIGGGARSALWRRIIADATGKPVFRAATAEAASLGAAILAAAGAGCFAGIREAAREMTSILPEPAEPDPSRHAFYTRLFEEVYRPLFPALQPYLNRLTSLSAKDASE